MCVNPDRVAKRQYAVFECKRYIGSAGSKIRIEDLSESVERGIEVVRASGGIGIRPEKVDGLLFQEAALKRESLEKRGGFTARPIGSAKDMIFSRDFKTTQQENPDRAGQCLHKLWKKSPSMFHHCTQVFGARPFERNFKLTDDISPDCEAVVSATLVLRTLDLIRASSQNEERVKRKIGED